MQLLIFIHKCLFHKNILPEIFHDYFTEKKSIHTYHTRKNSDLYMTLNNSSLGQRCITFRGSKFWNELPSNLKENVTVSTFKKNIKVYLSNRQ